VQRKRGFLRNNTGKYRGEYDENKTVGELILIIPYVSPFQFPDDFLITVHISIVSILEEGISEALDQRLLMSRSSQPSKGGLRISGPLF